MAKGVYAPDGTYRVTVVDGENTQATLAELIALIGDPTDDAGDATVIGLLKQIASNTDPA